MKHINVNLLKCLRLFAPNQLTNSCLLALLFLSVFSSTGFAQLASYTNNPTGAFASSAAHATVTPFSRVNGANSALSTCATGFKSITYPTTTVYSSANAAVEFTVTADAGYDFKATGFSADVARSSGNTIVAGFPVPNPVGPRKVRFAYSVDGGPWIDNLADLNTQDGLSLCPTTGATRSWTFPAALCVKSSISIRIYGFDSQGVGLLGSLHVFNATLSGTVNTEPTLTSITQAAVCVYTPPGTGTATFTAHGLTTVPGTVHTLTYTVGGGSNETATLTSDGSGNATFTRSVSAADDGQSLDVVSLSNNASGCSSTPDVSLDLEISLPPVIISQPTSLTACVGTIQGLSVSINDNLQCGESASIQWYKVGNPVPIQNNIGYSSTLSFNPISLTDAGSYYCVITCGPCSVTSNTVTVTVNALPVAAGTASPNPVCEGSTFNVSSTSTGSPTAYSWCSSPAGFTSTNQNPVFITPAAGTYTVKLTVTNSAGCTNSASVFTITVNAKPTVTGTPSPNPVCTGAPINFTSTSTGTAFSWNSLPAGFSSTAQNPSFTAPAVGTYTVRLSVTNSAGCTNSAAVFTVGVNALPTASGTVNPSLLCTGFPINFTSTSSGSPTAFSWNSSPAGFSSTQQNPNLSAPAAGTYTVKLTVTNSAGCTNSASVFTVTVTPAPIPDITVSPGNPVCSGSPLQLLAGVAGTSFSWSGSTGFTSTAKNPNISKSASTANAGAYSLTVTGAGGCTASASISVTVSDTYGPSAENNSPICAGGTLELYIGGNNKPAPAGYGEDTYRWQSPDGVVFTTTSVSPSWVRNNATPAMGGIYSVTTKLLDDGETVCYGYAETEVTVFAKPPANISGATEIQPPGFCTTLIANGGPGLFYQWAPPSGATTQSIGPICTPGVYSVTVTKYYNQEFGCSRTASVTVTVFSNETLQPSASGACVQGTLKLKTELDGSQFKWGGPLGFTSNQKTPSIANVDASRSGTYSVTVTSTSGLTASATVYVQILKKPVLTSVTTNPAIPVCAGSYVQFLVVCTDGDPANGVQYTWKTPSSPAPTGFVSNVKEPHINSIAFAQRGRFSVSAYNSCFTSQWAYDLQVSNTQPCKTYTTIPSRLASADDVSESITLNVSPNPLDHQAVVEVQLAVPSKISLKLYEVGTGRLLRTIDRAEELDRHRVEVDMSIYQFGNYLFTVESDQGQASKKVTKR